MNQRFATVIIYVPQNFQLGRGFPSLRKYKEVCSYDCMLPGTFSIGVDFQKLIPCNKYL